MSQDLFYNPTGGAFSNQLPMKTVDKLTYLNSIEGIYRYTGKVSLANYYPVKTLPSCEIDTDAEWPVVMPAGCIVSVIPIKDSRAYSAVEHGAGILASGEVYVSVSEIDGSVLKKSINYVYPKDVAGLIVPANGGTQTNDAYTDDCGTYGIITVSGDVAESGDIYIRAANAPIGIVNSRILADLRLRWLNYEAVQGSNGNAIAYEGVITIPYVGIYGAGVTGTVLAAVRAAVNAKHQYAWFDGTAIGTINSETAVGAYLMSDAYGRFTAWDGSVANQKFGKILETRNRVVYNLDEIIDSIPNSGMKGTDTGGLKARLYNFIKTILAKTAVKGTTYAADKENIKKVMYEALATDTTDVNIVIGQIDVAFGSLA